MSKAKGNSGETYGLADKETSFYDHETGFELVREATSELGDVVGNKTHTAIMSGRLLIVSAEGKSDLPDDLPGRKFFVAAGVNFEQFKALNEDDLGKIKGITAKLKEELLTWVVKFLESEKK
jgi:hypothetical protein